MSHTLEQIKEALERGATVFDEYENKVIQVFQYEGDWMHAYMSPEGYKVALDKDVEDWRVEECDQSDSHPPLGITYSDISNIDFKEMAMMYRKITNGNPPQTDPFEADGFHVECPNTYYVNGVAEELEQFMIEVPENCESVHQNATSVTCTSTPAQSWDDFPSYDFTDRATWIAQAWAIKEREEKAKEYYYVKFHEGEKRFIAYFGEDNPDSCSKEVSRRIGRFGTREEAQTLADKLNAVLDGAKVVKDAIALKTSAVCNHKAKDIHNIDWEATFNNL